MTISCAQNSLKSLLLTVASGTEKENRRTWNQIKVGKATRIRSGMREKEKELFRRKRRKRVRASKSERKRRQENVEGARKNGWLTVLADQISRMVRAPLNRSYFRSCSERARLTRRKTFDECPRKPAGR